MMETPTTGNAVRIYYAGGTYVSRLDTFLQDIRYLGPCARKPRLRAVGREGFMLAVHIGEVKG